MKTTENTRLTSGKHKGIKLRDVPDAYLKWILENLTGGDFHEWSIAAQEEQLRRKQDNAIIGDLEAQADAILRRADFDVDGSRRRLPK